MPVEFCTWLEGLEAVHVEQIGLKGTRNGALLATARRDFHAFVTLDRGILYQHNHQGHSLVIIVIRTKDPDPKMLRDRVEEVLAALATASAGDFIELPYTEG